MKKAVCLLLTFASILSGLAQRGYNYYKDSSRVGSPNAKAYGYFKKAYYDCIWKWSKEGADSAEYYLKLAIKEDPNYSAAYAFLAHVYQFQTYDGKEMDRKLALQKQYAEKALSFHPTTGDAYSVMSDLKWEEKDTAASLSLLRKAIAMEPDNVGNYIFLAIRFTQMGNQSDSAIFYLHRLLQYDPEYGQAFMKLGNVYNWNKENFDSAKYYYRKAIEHYTTVVPRDNRMMGGYYSLAEVFAKEKRYDSAVYYYNSFLKELEPSNMYIRDLFLSHTYKALYACYQALSKNSLDQYLSINKIRIANNQQDAKFLLGILEGEYGGMMSIDEDSVSEKYALPLAKKIQALPTNDPYFKVFAVYDEYALLKRLQKSEEALSVLLSFHSKAPEEPLTLLELGRMMILRNKISAGLAYLQKAKLHLNTVITKEGFVEELQSADFDKIRNTAAFKRLCD